MNNDLISRTELKKAISEKLGVYIDGTLNNRLLFGIIDNAPSVEPRIEYGTDGQPYRLNISNGKEFERPLCMAKDEAICEEMTADGHCIDPNPCPNKKIKRPQSSLERPLYEGVLFVDDYGINKVIEVDENGTVTVERIIPRDTFIEAYNKFINTDMKGGTGNDT